jgi:hypothetical protein
MIDVLGLRAQEPFYRAFTLSDFENYLETEFGSQSAVEQWAEHYLKEGGKDAELHRALSYALSMLVRAAGCYWDCRGGNHLEENLLRRAVNYSLACCRIARLGLYDEALALLRSLAEVTNLVQLFVLNRSALKEWTELSGHDRWQQFKPRKVRERITAFGQAPIVDKFTYGTLCEFGAHVTQASVFASHEAGHRGAIGARFSRDAFIMILNELSIIIGPLLPYAGTLVALPSAQSEQLESASKLLSAAANESLRLDKHRERLDRELVKRVPS